MKSLALVILLAATPAGARTVVFPSNMGRGDFAHAIGRVELHLGANGFTAGPSSCKDGTCRMTLADSDGDPASLIAAFLPPPTPAERQVTALATRVQAIALAKKLKAGTASAAEKDGLLLRLCFLLLSEDQ